MTVYLDASVIVANLIDEPATPSAKRWFRDAADELAISDLARGEVVAALHRAIRDGRHARPDIASRIEAFERWSANAFVQVMLMPADMRMAVDYVKTFDLALRMPDAIHLATCARLGLTLATFDRRLLRAAEALGVVAVRPG